MDKIEKIGWLEQLKIACLKPRQYRRLLEVAKGRVVMFFAVITLITTILGFGFDVLGFGISVGGAKNFILHRLPAFELKDGELQIEQQMDFTFAGVHFLADTKKDKVSVDDLSNKYSLEIAFAKDEMVLKNAVAGQVINRIPFSGFQNAVFDNQAMTALIPVIYAFIGIMFIVQWGVNVVSYLSICVFISMLVYFNQKTRLDQTEDERAKVSFGKIFKLSIYARVIFQLIETVGITAGAAIFSGMVWMFISYFGSYELLLMGFMKPENKESSGPVI